jgi:sucrose-phosphate synthase
MHIAFLNPQGNFDPADSHLAEHPDFGGQLVYVKQVALAMAQLGHKVDILTRQIIDPAWPEFSESFDNYPDAPGVRIIRLPAGPPRFLPKEHLWPYLGTNWVPNILNLYQQEGNLPDFFSAHYGDGGISAVLLKEASGIPFSFTAHSLAAQKIDKLYAGQVAYQELDQRYFFSRRLIAERTAMNHSLVNITSTTQERLNQYGHPAYQGAVDTQDDSRFAVIPPGVNLATFDKDIRSEAEEETTHYLQAMLKRDLLIDRLDLPCILASSRLDGKKNHLGLLQAYAADQALQRLSNLVILTSGLEDPLNDYSKASDPEQEVLVPLIHLTEKNGLRGKVSMFSVQGQTQLAAAYRYFGGTGGIFVLPALHEPFGLAPLEAMAAGMPAVVTKFGGPSESMQEGDEKYGVLVDPSQPIELSTALVDLFTHPGQWKRYANAGYNRVVSKYNWKKTAVNYLEIFKRSDADDEPQDLLRIHPYFSDPSRANDITIAELRKIYHASSNPPAWL